jgi:hypothetical protein
MIVSTLVGSSMTAVNITSRKLPGEEDYRLFIPLPQVPNAFHQLLTRAPFAGRYPSVKRYKDDAHHELCFVCRDGGELLRCNSCPNAVHFGGVCTSFMVSSLPLAACSRLKY